jgi:hypothetical protein
VPTMSGAAVTRTRRTAQEGVLTRAHDPPSAVPPDQAGDVFGRWVHRRCPEPLTDGGRYRPEPPERLLERLLAEDRPLPVDVSLTLGLGRCATYARAAELLLWARHAPEGPNCSSFRAAYYFLVDSHGKGLPA